MREVGIAVARLDLRNQPAFFGQGLPLELHRVERLVFGDRVDVHVRQRRGDQLRGHEALVEQLAAAQLRRQILRNHLVRTVVHGVLLQHLGIEGPVLHQLRGQLHEIALHLGQSAVLHVVEEEMERMPEFVEQRFGFVEGQQRGGVARRAGEVADDRHHGRHALAVLVGLLHVVAAPRALALAVAREIVEI